MTPRAAGIGLLVASIVVGVLSAPHLTSPAWGLVAAGTLSVALAAGGLGVVWMSRTTWGIEPRPEGKERPDSQDPRRARRSALIYGIVSLAFAAVGVAALVWAAVMRSFGPELIRFLFLVAVAGTLGVVLVRFARSPIVEPDDADEAAIDASGGADDADADEWRRLTRRDWFVVVGYSVPGLLIGGWVFVQLVQLPAVLSENSIVGAGIAVTLAVAGFAAIAWWMRRRFPEVWANPVTRRIRVGAREAEWSALTAAKVSTASVWPGAPRTLFLTLEGEDGLSAPLTLRKRDRLALTSTQRDLVVQMISESSVQMPRAAEDPGGRFSRFNFPEHVTRDDAVELVKKPPRAGERLPIPYA
jgi:FtsH-binding integral membrane protein